MISNTVLLIQAGHLETWRILPVADEVDECIMCLDLFVRELLTRDSRRRHWDRNMDLTICTLEQEDLPVGEVIQAGFESAVQTDIFYSLKRAGVGEFSTFHE